MSKKSKAPIKLDLSYGPADPNSGFIRPKGFDPQVLPWTLKHESVEEAFSAYLFHRLPAKLRGLFMDALYRVLIPGGKITIIVPYWTSARSIQDPLAEWPPVSEQSFLYFNKEFREANHIDYGIQADFDFVYGYTLDPEAAAKSDDTRPFWIKHYSNTVSDIHVVLTKK